jgi:homoserine dehydrogenase
LSAQPLNIAVAGLGTVGGGLMKLIADQADILESRSGRQIRVAAVSAKTRGKNRGFALDGAAWFDDATKMAAEADAEVVVELIGGAEGVARAVCETAISRGRSVVTANKALVAHHGTALARAAERAGVALAFEAAVAGGIPVVKALREGLAANRLKRVTGILNGTCNYILTQMQDSKREFDEVLAEAQALGYAEADPSFDVDGIDSAHKLAILASVAYGTELAFEAVHIEGIRHVSALDIAFAEELGYRIKLLGIARPTAHGIEQRVHPCMVDRAAPIAQVSGVFNAVVAEGDFVGSTMFQGRGAGALPTASSVAADLVDIARGLRAPPFAVPASKLAKLKASPMARHRGAYYIRLMVQDRPGVIAQVATALAEHDISIEAVIQRARHPTEAVPVVFITHETEEAAMNRVLEKIAALGTVVEPPRMIRIEPSGE